MALNVWKIDLYEKKKASDFFICKTCCAAKEKKIEVKIADHSVVGLVRHLKQHEEYKKKFDKLEDKSGEVVAMECFVVCTSGLFFFSLHGYYYYLLTDVIMYCLGGLSSLDKKVINYVAEN